MDLKCITKKSHLKDLISQIHKLGHDHHEPEQLKHFTLTFYVEQVSCHALFWLELNKVAVSYSGWEKQNSKEIMKNIETSWPELNLFETTFINKLIISGINLVDKFQVNHFLSSQALVNAICTITCDNLIKMSQSHLPVDARIVVNKMLKTTTSELNILKEKPETTSTRPIINITGDNELVIKEEISSKTYLTLNKQAIYKGSLALLNLLQNVHGLKDFLITQNFLIPKVNNNLLIKEARLTNDLWCEIKETLPNDIHAALTPFGSIIKFEKFV